MVIHCVAAEHGGLIKNKKESSWVKLKAFPTNVGWPNKTANECCMKRVSSSEHYGVYWEVLRGDPVGQGITGEA